MEQLLLEIDGVKNHDVTDRKTDRPPQTLQEKIEKAKRALLLASDMSRKYYDAPLLLAYSGGKDSDVLLHLAEHCLGVSDFEVINGHTTVDAPETVYHIRDTFKRLNARGIKTRIDYHKLPDGTNETMWTLIPKKQIPPSRFYRYCCRALKETTTPHRLCALGIRASESSKRQGRDIFSTRGKTYKEAKFFSLNHAEEVHKESLEINDPAWDCTLIKTMKAKDDSIVNPIYEWLDQDIWDYIKQENIRVNPLYDKGYTRVGCIGCPLAGYEQIKKQFADYPKYKELYISAFDRMIKARNERNNISSWKTGQEVFEWWIGENKHNVKGQISMFD